MKLGWMSIRTGELVYTFKDVLKTIVIDYKTYHILNLLWKRVRE